MTRLLPDFGKAGNKPLSGLDTARRDAPTVQELPGDGKPSNEQSRNPPQLSAPALVQFASSSMPDSNSIQRGQGSMEPSRSSGQGQDHPEEQSTAGPDPLDDLISRVTSLRHTLSKLSSVLYEAASVDIDPSAFVSSLSEVMAEQLDKSTSLLAAHKAKIFPYVNEQIYHTRRAEAKLLEALIPAGQTLQDFLAKDSIDDSVFEQQILPLQTLFEEIQKEGIAVEKSERQAWIKHINESQNGKGIKDFQQNFILKHEVCSLPPSKDTDKVIDSMIGELETSEAQIAISKLYSENLDKNWEPLAESSAASYRSGHA
jgi:hypothetical protein